jgi:glutathione S-transferase
MTTTPELFQFKISHFNEKARWALDYKGIEHTRRSLLPGPHKFTVKRLSGQEQVPVLRVADRVIPGSDAIIDYVEAARAEPALYPRDPALKRRALEVQAKFDADVGPAIRLALFHDLLGDQRYFASLLTIGQPRLARVGYRTIFPLVRVLMSRAMQINADNAERAREVVRGAYDLVAKESAATGYLVGDRFSVADLTAAALLAPGVEMDPSPFAYEKPFPPVLRAWWSRWREHPGTAWVKTMFARHRGASKEKTGW